MFNLFNPKPNPVIEGIFHISIIHLAEIEKYKSLNKKGQFEFFIFCAFLILQTKEYSLEIKSKYLRYLVNIRKDYQITLSSGETVDLINNRMPFYAIEINNSLKSNRYINTKIYGLLYETPLKAVPIDSSNFPEAIKFSVYLFNLIKDLIK